MEERRDAADRLTVDVWYREDLPEPYLVVEPPSFELADGQWVVWKFHDVPEGRRAVPAIRFDRPLGPFHTLRTAPDSYRVVGKGNVGAEGDGHYTYHVALFFGPPEAPEVVAARDPVELVNRATRIDTTPEVRVRYIPGQEGKEGEFLVEPFVLHLNDGDVPFWTFYDLPEGGSIYLRTVETQEGTLHPLIGPFQDMTSLRGGSGGGTSGGGASQFVIGTGQGKSPPGRYHYHIELVGAGGETLASGDPVIDNGGPPG